MGILRLVLALSVIAAHVGPFFGLSFFGNGVMAVETFYLISGFYMALVLTTRYQTYQRDFYFNRFLRLFPVYWMLLAFFLVVSSVYWLVAGHPLGALVAWAASDSIPSRLWAGASNLVILGSDWAELVSNPPVSHVNQLIAIQPAWSIAIEILFYIFAPFVLRLRLGTQAGLFVAAVIIRCAIWFGFGGHWSAWLYYFAPATWVFFMGGIFAYHLLTRLEPLPQFAKWAGPIGWILTAVTVGAVLFYSAAGLLRFQDWRYYAFIGLALPFIFTASKRNRVDGSLAAWSYPVYLAHAVILTLYAPLRHFVPGEFKAYAVLILTFALSAIVIHFDRKLQHRFKVGVQPPSQASNYRPTA